MKFLLLLTATLTFSHLAEAKLVTKSVPYEQNGVKLQGYLAYDDAKISEGKLPGVLVIHEWWGLNDFVKGKANQLAEQGFVAFAADMYGKGMVTGVPKQAGEWAGATRPMLAERAQAGLDQLMKVEGVDAKKLAAIGFCFGGSAAQVLAYSGAPLAGIVSFHGSPVPAPKEVAGKVKAKFLLLNGAVDPMVKPDDRADLEKSLEEAKVDYQSIDYAGAIHAFTNPNADKVAAEKGMLGKIGYNEAAASRSWKQMGVFFEEIFGK